MPEDLVGVLVVGIVMLVPIVAMLTKHQLRMAEMFREERMNQQNGSRLQQDNDVLRKELADVKALLYEQSIAIDNLAKHQSDSGQLSNRLEDRTP